MTSRWPAIGLGLLGAGLVLAAASRGWTSETVAGLPGALPKVRTGADLLPAVPALALAAAASTAVLGTAGRLLRIVAAALLVLAGAGIVIAVLTGLDGASAGAGRTTTGWPWVAVGGAVPVVLAGLVGLARSRSWPAPSRRYERTAPKPEAGADDWASLSQGHDPT